MKDRHTGHRHGLIGRLDREKWMRVETINVVTQDLNTVNNTIGVLHRPRGNLANTTFTNRMEGAIKGYFETIPI